MDLLWCDLETTGLKDREHSILEVHISHATLDHPFDARELLDAPLHFELDEKARALIDPFVLDMHSKNGLWVECQSSKWTLEEVEQRLLDLIPKIEDKNERPVLAGNSVHFDLGFLRWHMPHFAARLSHRVYDVSAISLFARSLGMPKLPKDETHRAKADVLASMRQASACAQYLMNLNAGP